MEMGKMLSEKEHINIKSIADSIVSMFAVSANQKNIDLQLQVDEQVPKALLGDGMKLTQVLTNLIGNAVKFTESGYVKLSIKVVSMESAVCSLQFLIEDTGVGIAEQEQAFIFETFAQAHQPQSIKSGGSGLGLSISKKLIEIMGGTIQLKSKIGIGSAFWFELPFQIAELQQPPKYAAPPITSLFNGKYILIADDNHVNVFVLKQFLQRWGAHTLEAINGDEAIRVLEKNEVDLILMDVQMPVKDGIAATKEIRASEAKWSKIPIIAITASHEDEVKKDVLKSGMNDYVIKPFVPEDLREKLLRYLV
jgi:CheY-like chemotaxis protein/two-component sensor histidine kinase